MSTLRQIDTCRTLTSVWAPAGFVNAKSSVATLHVVDQPLHVGHDERIGDPADHREHPHQGQRLGSGPTVEAGSTAEHQRQADEAGGEAEGGLQHLDEEVRSVLQFVQGAHPEERPCQPMTTNRAKGRTKRPGPGSGAS